MSAVYRSRPCTNCNAPFQPVRHDAKYCCSICRVQAFRRRRALAAAELQLAQLAPGDDALSLAAHVAGLGES